MTVVFAVAVVIGVDVVAIIVMLLPLLLRFVIAKVGFAVAIDVVICGCCGYIYCCECCC